MLPSWLGYPYTNLSSLIGRYSSENEMANRYMYQYNPTLSNPLIQALRLAFNQVAMSSKLGTVADTAMYRKSMFIVCIHVK